jgi:hypothetical protein
MGNDISYITEMFLYVSTKPYKRIGEQIQISPYSSLQLFMENRELLYVPLYMELRYG